MSVESLLRISSLGIIRQPRAQRVPPARQAPPPVARPQPPSRESARVQGAEAETRQLFRRRGRRRTLLTAGQAEGAPAEGTRKQLLGA